MQQQPINPNPVQVVVIAQPAMMDKQMKYRNMKTSLARLLIGLGVAQLLIGILCIIFQGVAVWVFVSGRYYFGGLDYIGHGFWNGIIFSITGPFGISGGLKRNRCQVVAFNVLSIISAAVCACIIGIAVPGAIIYASDMYYCYYDYSTTTSSYYYSYSGYHRCLTIGSVTTGVAMEALMAVLGLVEVIVATWSAAICCTIGACCCDCGDSCCCPPSSNQNQFLMTGQPFAGQQQMFIANQQQMAFNQQVIPNQPPTFSPNPQQPMINLNPQQQSVGYNQPLSAYTGLSPGPGHQGSYQGLNTRSRETLIYGESRAIPANRTSTYDEIHDYDQVVNEER